MKKVILVAVMAMAVILGFSATSQAFFIDFETGYGRNNQPIDDIPGVAFLMTGGFPWIYGDSSTGSWNTRSIDLGYGGGSYQHYGNVFAFLGTQGQAGRGIVDFTNDDGTWFQTGYTSLSNFYLEGYDINNVMIASTFGGGNLYGADMNFLRIDAPAGQYFDYVIVHDTGNYFLVDNMSGNSSGIPGGDEPVIPEPATLSLLGMGLVGLISRKRKA